MFLFISLTSKLNLFFRSDVLSDTVLTTGLTAFTYVDVMLLALLRPSSLITTLALCLWQTKAILLLTSELKKEQVNFKFVMNGFSNG